VVVTDEELNESIALSGAGDIVNAETGEPEPPGPSIFKSPAPPTFERAFVGKDDDGVYVPLAILGGELAQLATKVFEDPVVVAYTFATIISRQETFRTADARAVQAVRKFLDLVNSGQARVGIEL